MHTSIFHTQLHQGEMHLSSTVLQKKKRTTKPQTILLGQFPVSSLQPCVLVALPYLLNMRLGESCSFISSSERIIQQINDGTAR
jgi:hypothetical protein